MKNFFAFTALSIALFTVVGCGSTKQEATVQTPTEKTEQEKNDIK